MIKKFKFIILVVCMLSITSCEKGISGSVLGSRLSCSSNIDGGRCQGGFRKLSGTISEDMSMTRTGFHQVLAEVTASVSEGGLRVYLVDPEGVETSKLAQPGKQITIAGAAEAYFDSFRVYFEAVDGEATGIEFVVDFTYP